MADTNSLQQVKEDDITVHYSAAYELLKGFDYAPRFAKRADDSEAGSAGRSAGIASRRRFRSTTVGLSTSSANARKSLSGLIETIENVQGEDPLVSDLEALVLRSLRRALSTATALSHLFAEQTGLNNLQHKNAVGRLDANDKAQFEDLLETSSLVALFVFANMLEFLVTATEIDIETPDIGTVDELVLDNPQVAHKGALWELEQKIKNHAENDDELLAVIVAFCEQLMAQVNLRAENAKHTEAFSRHNYRVEADDFEITGFSATAHRRSSKLTMSFKKPDQVIGNHIAKYQSMKLAKMLMAYDFGRQLNPFADMGGFIFTFMGDGMPGTGKTTLIQMMAGLLNDYCKNAGYPFRYANLSTESIDSYQGKSGQNAKKFIRTVLDPGVIGFGTIDDIDQIAGKRGDRQSSSGQQEITAVLMESFAGANTVVRGNCTFGMFSNYPENVDDALRQRAGARFLVDGPKTQEDYIDILHLLMGKNHDIPVGEHELYVNQQIERAVSSSYDSYTKPHEEKLLSVFERVKSNIGELDTIAKMGTYLKAIQEADSSFTGRAIKNITDAVKVRAMDFELPDEWMEKPDLFLFKDYDTKLAMLKEMTKPITTDMVIQEINRYADSEFRYADKSDEVAIEDQVRAYRLTTEAQKRYKEELTNS